MEGIEATVPGGSVTTSECEANSSAAAALPAIRLLAAMGTGCSSSHVQMPFRASQSIDSEIHRDRRRSVSGESEIAWDICKARTGASKQSNATREVAKHVLEAGSSNGWCTLREREEGRYSWCDSIGKADKAESYGYSNFAVSSVCVPDREQR